MAFARTFETEEPINEKPGLHSVAFYLENAAKGQSECCAHFERLGHRSKAEGHRQAAEYLYCQSSIVKQIAVDRDKEWREDQKKPKVPIKEMMLGLIDLLP